MCLILFAVDVLASTPLIVAANRDEYFSRPTEAAQFWHENPNILAGKDCVAGGTWLGITRTGRFAAVTNIREPAIVVNNPLSRGELVYDFLQGDVGAEHFLQGVQVKQQRYRGFNLLAGEFTHQHRELYYFSNRRRGITRLVSGIYGLSNHLLDSQWPKVIQGKAGLQRTLQSGQRVEQYHQTLRDFLEDQSLAADNLLPNTGVDYAQEKALSAAFITLPGYGTRTSTVVTVSDEATLFSEKNYLQSPRNDTQCLSEIPTQFHIDHWHDSLPNTKGKWPLPKSRQ